MKNVDGHALAAAIKSSLALLGGCILLVLLSVAAGLGFYRKIVAVARQKALRVWGIERPVLGAKAGGILGGILIGLLPTALLGTWYVNANYVKTVVYIKPISQEEYEAVTGGPMEGTVIQLPEEVRNTVGVFASDKELYGKRQVRLVVSQPEWQRLREAFIRMPGADLFAEAPATQEDTLRVMQGLKPSHTRTLNLQNGFSVLDAWFLRVSVYETPEDPIPKYEFRSRVYCDTVIWRQNY